MPRTSKTAAAADKADEGQAGTAYGHTINGVAASSADLKFILALVGNLESKPEVNWEELAVSLGLKNKKGKPVYMYWVLYWIPCGWRSALDDICGELILFAILVFPPQS